MKRTVRLVSWPRASLSHISAPLSRSMINASSFGRMSGLEGFSFLAVTVVELDSGAYPALGLST